MKAATIVPTPWLDVTKEDQYNMCLYQEVKAQPKYAKFFKTMREHNKFVIMDNGAAEGVNPTAEELMQVYPLVDPSEIVLPDMVGDKLDTMDRSFTAYTTFLKADLHKKYQFMAVPQGSTFKEWLECLNFFLSLDEITTIGVSKFTSRLFRDEMGSDTNIRLECVDAILQCSKTRQIHLLGCNDTPEELIEIHNAFGDAVRGVDSALAYVFTRNNQVMYSQSTRPDNEHIDFVLGDPFVEDELLLLNKTRWENFGYGLRAQ